MAVDDLIDDLYEARYETRRAEDYYHARSTGQQRDRSALLPPELRYLESRLSWTRLVVAVLEERLEIKDVHVPGYEALTDRLREWRRRADLAELETQVHTEALITGRGYVSVAQAEDGPRPTFAAESAAHMIHRTDDRTGATLEALRLYGDDDEFAVHYEPDVTRYLRWRNRGWEPDPSVPGGAVVEHGLGEVPVVPFINRSRVNDRRGRPEARDIWSLQEDVSRILTDLAAASALMAVPQRIVFGVDDSEMLDENGRQIPAAELYTARLLSFSDPAAKVAEYAAAQLSQFTSTMVAYARQASALSGVPIPYFGVASEANPASGDAQRADEDRLVKRGERLGRGFTSPWRQTYRIGARLAGETDPDALAAITIRWRNPATVTMAAQSDFVAKLATVRVPSDGLLTPGYLLEQLGLTPEEIEDMTSERELGDMRSILAEAAREPIPTTAEDVSIGGNPETGAEAVAAAGGAAGTE